MTVTKGRLHIGTSGWSYRHWREVFYPPGLPSSRWFEHYRKSFSSVELNAPFYRLPTSHAVQTWETSTSTDFAFSVKGSRFISHNKKLKDPEEHLERFFAVMDGLGEKMAVVLWQLPPSWNFNAERLETFLSTFRAREGKRRACFEFRNPSWYKEESLAILHRYNAGFCIYDLAGHLAPLAVTADFVYVRLHGPSTAKYAGEYRTEGLTVWVERIRAWLAEGRDAFVYFDNDGGAAAVRDALQLQEMMRSDRQVEMDKLQSSK